LLRRKLDQAGLPLSQLTASFAGADQSLADACALDTIQQEMERLPGGTRRLAVQLRLNLPPEWIWAVLTDYDSLSRFIPNLQSSRLLWRRANVVGLEQEGAQTFMGMRFKARVQLELTRTPRAAPPLLCDGQGRFPPL